MKRTDIPNDVAAKVLFQSDRTCCVCRTKGKPIQIHHIDGKKSNPNIANLAILCFDCHTDTQVSGGFHRKLDAEQVILYRDDWVTLVARDRASNLGIANEQSSPDLQVITTELDAFKENKEYALLAMYYNSLGNTELRDKYVELALVKEKSADTEIFLRTLQGKIELVEQTKIDQEIAKMTENKDWSQLARLYRDIKEWDKVIECYCKTVSESIKQGNTFSAAFYLKELSTQEIHEHLFEKAYGEFANRGDIWWQVRSLQELGWNTELEDLLRSKRAEIEKADDPHLLKLLYQVTGDTEKLLQITKAIANRTKLARVPGPKKRKT